MAVDMTDETIAQYMERIEKMSIKFIRDGKSRDSAGVLNTTNTFIEKN